ncbi:MAG: hypothetical protein AABZ53_05455 [Planctomycetota bacterium]
MNKLVPALFALAGAGFLVPPVLALIAGEPVRGAFAVLGLSMLTLALVFFMAGQRKSGGGTAPPTA